MFRGQLLNTSKQTHEYYLGGIKERYITISSEFDSGNLGDVKQISDFSYRITSACDCSGTPSQHSTRSWFYFSVKGFPPSTRGRFLVNKVNILWSFVNSKMGPSYGYHPVYNDGKGWKKLEEPANVYENNNGEVEIMFDYLFKEEGEEVKFAITYPYEYERCVNWVSKLEEEYSKSEEVYFQKEILVKSTEERDVYLLTVGDRKSVQVAKDREERIEGLFPDLDKERPFKDKKPVILISARVHPGQTPSSYALQGLMNFLLNRDDLRSNLLRKFFTFKIVPMLNPDGVHNGNYRMDMFGQNLNRYYNNTCTLSKQPSIFALKSLMEYYSKQNRMMFYFDLHAHPARKGCFVYGNALGDFVHQVQNHVFCKLMAINTQYFEYQCCNFSKKHMKMKDRFEELTKQGCGRVFAYKCSGMIHSFTLQLGYHFTNNTSVISEAGSQDFKVNNLRYSPLLDSSLDPPQLTPKAFETVGESLLISVLDLIQKNPYSRLPNTQYCTLENLRRLIAFEVFHQDERFRMYEIHTYTKVKQINELIEESFYGKIQGKFVLQSEFDWPACVRGSNKDKEERLPMRENSGYKHSNSCLDRVQLPEITGKGSPHKLMKGRSYSVKKDQSDRQEEKYQPSALDSVESSDESESEARKTDGTERMTPASSISPDHPPKMMYSAPKTKLRLFNLKLSLAHSPLQGMMRFSEGSGIYPDNSCSSFSNSNRIIKQVNLTFQQNFIVLPNVGERLSPTRQQPPKQPSPYQTAPSPQKQYDFLTHPSQLSLISGTLRQIEMQRMLKDEQQQQRQKQLSDKPPQKTEKVEKAAAGEQQLRDQLMKQMQYFKKQIKQQFSKDIKKEVSDQINRNSFVRSYLKNKKNIDYAKSRKNKFFPGSQKDILSVSSIKPEDRHKLLKLPSISK